MSNDTEWDKSLSQESPDCVHISGVDGTRIRVSLDDVPDLASMLNDAAGRYAESTSPIKEAIEIVAEVIRKSLHDQTVDDIAWQVVCTSLTPELLRSLADSLDDIVEAEVLNS